MSDYSFTTQNPFLLISIISSYLFETRSDIELNAISVNRSRTWLIMYCRFDKVSALFRKISGIKPINFNLESFYFSCFHFTWVSKLFMKADNFQNIIIVFEYV